MLKNSLKIETEIASGGEGKIFKLKGQKVYKEFHNSDNKIAEKLDRIMLRNINLDSICTPVQLVEENGKTVGYTMKNIEGTNLKNYLLFTSMGKRNIKKSNLIDIATLLASSFSYLHSKRVLVGDVSDNNVLIDENLNIHLIDCDSFQVDKYLCEVGTDEFTPAEMMGKNFKTTPRTLNSEYFSLGVLLFKILIPGRHPFTVTNGGSSIENIKNGSFAYPLANDYDFNTPLDKKLLSTWNEMPLYIKECFFRTFKTENRVSPKEWLEVLTKYKMGILENSYSNSLFSEDSVANSDVAVSLDRRTGIGNAQNILNSNGTKIGVLEISTKAIKLLVRGFDNELKDFSYEDFGEANGGFREGRLTNIGKFLDKDRNMNISALKKAIDYSIREFLAKAKELNVKNLYCVATAAIRGAKNRDEILRFLKTEYNLSCRVLSRDEENKLTTNAFKYTGKIHSNGIKVLEDSIKKNYLFIDQGGGSTEIAILRGFDNSLICSKSLNFGSTILLNALTINSNLNTPLCSAFEENLKTVKSKINNTLKKEVKDIVVHECISVGTAITSATGKKGNKKQHCTVMNSEAIQKSCFNAMNFLLEKYKTVGELLAALKAEDESNCKNRVLDSALTKALGLPAFLEILKKFNLDKLVVSGTGLWYGAFYNHLEEELGMHEMDIAN
ncbi:MAG: protein kinase domain-containing protein [Fusobacteriaceae bacterium]